MSTTKLEIQIEERFSLMGYAYWRDSRGEGRVLWALDPVEKTRKKKEHHKLTISPSWGVPTDDTLEEIKHRIARHVQDGKRPPAIFTPIKKDDEA